MAIDLWLTLSIGQPCSKQFDIEQTSALQYAFSATMGHKRLPVNSLL